MIPKVVVLVLFLVGSSTATPLILNNIWCSLMYEMNKNDDSSNLCKQTVGAQDFDITGGVFGYDTKATISIYDVNAEFCSTKSLCGVLAINDFKDLKNGSIQLSFDLNDVTELHSKALIKSDLFNKGFGQINLTANTTTTVNVDLTVATGKCTIDISDVTVGKVSDISFQTKETAWAPMLQTWLSSNGGIQTFLAEAQKTGLGQIINEMDFCTRLIGWLN